MSLVRTFSVELVSNIPIWLGFIVAAKLLWQSRQNQWRAVLVLLAASLVSATLILLVEPLKRGGSAVTALDPGQLIAMVAVFMVIGLSALWYLMRTAGQSQWKIDLVLAISLGLVLTTGEAFVVNIWDVQILVLHALSMVIAVSITLPMMRYFVAKNWLTALGGVMVLTILVSALIVAVEYVRGA